MAKHTAWAVIGATMVAVTVAFAYVGGWLTPQRLGPVRMIQAFEAANGRHRGYRRNHAKGLCVTGFFDSNGAGTQYSKAAVFAAGRVPVEGRFALAGGQPFQADTPRAVRSLALRFRLSDGEEWRTGMNAIPVFAVNTPQAFYEQLLATGNPQRMAQFLAAHPESARAREVIGSQVDSSGFANSRFNSLDAFELVAANGSVTSVRWAMVPDEPFAVDDAADTRARAPNYLFDAVSAELQHRPLQWHLMITLAQAGDPTNDATVAWPVERQQVDVGTLTLDHAQSEQTGACRDINFDPLVLPAGIRPSDDPLLSARSATYARSYTLRVGERP
ncbi:MAG TPA: catalase family peroxidase [Steroidobacteraceae bacterium]|nr:catalase family peroxidase [Steroidobacteraceae bacterium]